MSFDTASAPPGTCCPFCVISSAYPSPPSPPAPSPLSTSASIPSPTDVPSPIPTNPDPTLVSPQAFLVLSTPLCLAFLDIMPLSPGHLLVCTRRHHEKLTDVGEEEAQELGRWLRVLSKVLGGVTGVWDWNIVQNNGAAAAQVVPHVHFHIIPRPALTEEARNRSFTMFGRGRRSELDEEEAEELVGRLRLELAKELEREARAKM